MQVTGVGSLMAVHFNPRPVRRPADTEGDDLMAAALFHLDMLARGQYLARRGLITLSLPLVEADYDALVEAVEEFLASLASVLGG